MTLTPPHAIGWDEEPPHTLRDEGSPLTPNRMTFGAVTGGQRPEVPWVIPGWLTDRDRVFIGALRREFALAAAARLAEDGAPVDGPGAFFALADLFWTVSSGLFTAASNDRSP